MIAQWNEDNPDQPMMIRMPNILRRVREMGKDKAQRIADTAPRAMRQRKQGWAPGRFFAHAVYAAWRRL